MSARFKIKLVEKPGKHMFEKQPRYDVMVNDEPFGELYYNMSGYAGYLPTIHGGRMDIGERGISAFRREVRLLNREAAASIKAATEDERRVVLIRPTDNPRSIFAISDDGAERRTHILCRDEWRAAQSLIADQDKKNLFDESHDIGLGFFTYPDDDNDATVQLFPGDEPLLGEFPDIKADIVGAIDAEIYERCIDGFYETDDEDVLVVVGRRIRDEADPEPYYVDALSFRLNTHRYGDDLNIGDLRQVSPAPISDRSMRADLGSQFTWMDFDCDEDAAARHQREQEALTGSEDGPGF